VWPHPGLRGCRLVEFFDLRVAAAVRAPAPAPRHPAQRCAVRGRCWGAWACECRTVRIVGVVAAGLLAGCALPTCSGACCRASCGRQQARGCGHQGAASRPACTTSLLSHNLNGGRAARAPPFQGQLDQVPPLCCRWLPRWRAPGPRCPLSARRASTLPYASLPYASLPYASSPLHRLPPRPAMCLAGGRLHAAPCACLTHPVASARPDAAAAARAAAAAARHVAAADRPAQRAVQPRAALIRRRPRARRQRQRRARLAAAAAAALLRQRGHARGHGGHGRRRGRRRRRRRRRQLRPARAGVPVCAGAPLACSASSCRASLTRRS